MKFESKTHMNLNNFKVRGEFTTKVRLPKSEFTAKVKLRYMATQG